MLGPQRQPHSLRQVVAQSKFVAAEFAALTEETGVKTMAKQTIEIDVPDGMKVGDQLRYANAVTVYFAPEPPKTKWRPPTKADLLGVNSIPGRVRDGMECTWRYVVICSVTTYGTLRYLDADGCRWKYAEIEVPVDEQPPREAWVWYVDGRTDPWKAAYSKEEHANNEHAEVIHMIEIRKPTSESKT